MTSRSTKFKFCYKNPTNLIWCNGTTTLYWSIGCPTKGSYFGRTYSFNPSSSWQRTLNLLNGARRLGLLSCLNVIVGSKFTLALDFQSSTYSCKLLLCHYIITFSTSFLPSFLILFYVEGKYLVEEWREGNCFKQTMQSFKSEQS